jgi:hypothetical protein
VSEAYKNKYGDEELESGKFKFFANLIIAPVLGTFDASNLRISPLTALAIEKIESKTG